MALAALKAYFNPPLFIIDEQPVEVCLTRAEPDAPEAESDNPLDSVFTGMTDPLREDFISQISAMLVEQIKLVEKAKMLELNTGGSDEFERFTRQLMPFLDNFDRLLDLGRKHPPSSEIDNWLKSVEALYYRIVNLLDSFGLRFISAVGKPVNLDYQEVVEYRTTNMHRHNTVIKELQKAVVFRDHLIRDAKVVVACNSEDQEEA